MLAFGFLFLFIYDIAERNLHFECVFDRYGLPIKGYAQCGIFMGCVEEVALPGRMKQRVYVGSL